MSHYTSCGHQRNLRQRAPYELGEKSSESATLSVKHPLFRVFAFEDCNGFRIYVGTVGGHLGDRLGPGVDRAGQGDGTIPRGLPRLGGAGDNAQPGEIRPLDKRSRGHDGALHRGFQ